MMAILAFLILLPLIAKFGPKGAFKWLQIDNSRRGVVGVSILLIILSLACIAKTAHAESKFFNRLYVEAGYDYDRGISPQCEDSDPDNRLASKLRAGGTVYQFERPQRWFKRIEVDGYYFHASGFICKDKKGNTVDSLAVSAKIIIYER